MEIGVQTKGIYPERNAKQALQMIRNAGFTNIDFNIDAFLLNTDVYAGRINSFFDQDIEELKRYSSNEGVHEAIRNLRVTNACTISGHDSGKGRTKPVYDGTSNSKESSHCIVLGN